MSSEVEIVALAEALRSIIADENIRVGWKEYGEHIRKGGAEDLSARVSMAIAHAAYLLGRHDGHFAMMSIDDQIAALEVAQ